MARMGRLKSRNVFAEDRLVPRLAAAAAELDGGGEAGEPVGEELPLPRDAVVELPAGGLLARRLGKTLDLDLENPALLVEAYIALVGLIAALTIVEARRRLIGRVLGLELETRRKPREEEKKWAQGWVGKAPTVREGLGDLMGVLLNSREFLFNH